MKKVQVFLIVFIPLAFCGAHGSVNTWGGSLQYDEDWGYVDARNTVAHVFWWLYQVKPLDVSRPLFIMLQGGPGASASGFGNFMETGPKGLNGSDNLGTWLQIADLVYIDAPAGSGFSYVENHNYAQNSSQVAEELLSWLHGFLAHHSEYRTRPVFLVSEGYAGKFAVEFAQVLREASLINLRGLIMGAPWISPGDFLASWGTYLHVNSLIDDQKLTSLNSQAELCQIYLNRQDYAGAENCYVRIQNMVQEYTGGVSWFNILKAEGSDTWNTLWESQSGETKDDLSEYMNSVVRGKLGVIPSTVEFETCSNHVLSAMFFDLMVPIYKEVDDLLKAGVNLVIYTGNEDLYSNGLGTSTWINRLTWDGMNLFNSSTRYPLKLTQFPLAGYKKGFENLQVWSIIGAGQMLAHDAPQQAIAMLQNVVRSYLK
ncbi:unnamed protein product [Caenorhabditis angaria]|uniref:Carboxypeptidase n=1 Tax=Caenorhabditis angaria TaxID=860376 RepID=A0A9P1N735_9PELO|nr:unnamed protein product [Caenorhabditis angaria]